MTSAGNLSQANGSAELLAEVQRAYAVAAAEGREVTHVSVARREVRAGDFEWEVHVDDDFQDFMTHFDDDNHKAPAELAASILGGWDADWDDLLRNPENPVSGGWAQRSEINQP